jgi:uncharacterized protein YjaG (DUF416 family)
MNYQTFIESLKTRVALLSVAQRKELGLAVCKKLFFDYQIFSHENSWGDSDLLLDGINFIQKSNLEEVDVLQTNIFIEEIEKITPDTEDFSNCSYALNACTAVLDTLNYLISKNIDSILSCCTYLNDTVDFKIQEPTTLPESQINSHPAMIEARNFLLKFG